MTPVQITFRNLAHSDALEEIVRERAGWLEQFYERIQACRVTIEFSDKRHERGRRLHVRIELSVPGEDIVISRAPSLHGSLKDFEEATLPKKAELDRVHRHAAVALHEAFSTARRRLLDHADRVNGNGQAHAANVW